jgi:hypothetical protein
MDWGISAIVLVCSSAIPVQICNPDNAVAVMLGQDAVSPIECALNAQEMVGSTSFRESLRADGYMKVICVPKEKVGEIVQHAHATNRESARNGSHPVPPNW